jgi:heme exporter protein D
VGGFARSVWPCSPSCLPVALIWVVAVAARSARTLRQEANRLQASIDAMRIAYVEQQQKRALNIKPELCAGSRN